MEFSQEINKRFVKVVFLFPQDNDAMCIRELLAADICSHCKDLIEKKYRVHRELVNFVDAKPVDSSHLIDVQIYEVVFETTDLNQNFKVFVSCHERP